MKIFGGVFLYAVCVFAFGSFGSMARATTIVNNADGSCLVDPGYSTAVSKQYAQWTCDGGSDDNFQFTYNSTDGTYTIKNAGSGLCADDLGYATSLGSPIAQYTCNGNSNQKWILTSVSSGIYTIKNKYSGLCASFSGSTSNGAPLVQASCSGATAFRISLSGTSASPTPSPTPVSEPYFSLDSLTGWRHTEDQASHSGSCSDTTTEYKANSCVGPLSTGYATTVPSGAPNSSGRLFQLKYYGGSADQRFSVGAGTDSAARHFIYDVYVYLARTDLLYNLEMDINHTVNIGYNATYIMASQCNFPNDRWEIGNGWTNHTSIPCKSSLSPGKWHHVQIQFHHDTSYIYYDGVTVDGVYKSFNQYRVNGPENLGWGNTGGILPNFQLDANGSVSSSGTVNVYTSDFRIYHW